MDTEKKMGVGSIALFTICAVIVVDTLTASASLGVSSIGWWLLTFVVFVIPYGLITAELSTAYPGEGGIYDWVKEAFGYKWAVRTTWYYWINVGLWMPAVYILFAGMFAELFYPDMPLTYQVAICIALTWFTVWVCNVSADIGVMITNIGAVLKVIIILVLGFGGMYYAFKNGVANDFSIKNMMPSLDTGIAFLPAIVFNLMGFELVATMTKEIKDVKKMPLAIFCAAIIIVFLYLFGTIGILLALPVENIGLVSGIVDTLKTLFGEDSIIVPIVGIIGLLTFIGNMVTWTMGSSRAAAEAASEGELPKVVGYTSKIHDTPVGANVITGLVSTCVIICYAIFAADSDDLFWTVFAFSSCIFLLPYLMMFPAHVRLRIKDPDTERPFKIAGGILGQRILCWICFLVILQAVVFFVFPNITDNFSIDWKGYTGPVVIGLIITIGIGEVLLLNAITNNNNKEGEI